LLLKSLEWNKLEYSQDQKGSDKANKHMDGSQSEWKCESKIGKDVFVQQQCGNVWNIPDENVESRHESGIASEGIEETWIRFGSRGVNLASGSHHIVGRGERKRRRRGRRRAIVDVIDAAGIVRRDVRRLVECIPDG
jgi:hypothetical protein